MRYKYELYSDKYRFLISSVKFAIFINFDINTETIIEGKTNVYHYNKANDVDILFDFEKKYSLIFNLQKLKYFLNENKGKNVKECYQDLTMLGIRITYTLKYDKEIEKRLVAIIDDVLKKYNPFNEEYFKYDLENKEFIKYLLNFNYDYLSKKLPEHLKNDEEIIQEVLTKTYSISNTTAFEINKNRIMQFVKSDLKGNLKINHKFVDKELVKLFKEKKVIYERIDD